MFIIKQAELCNTSLPQITLAFNLNQASHSYENYNENLLFISRLIKSRLLCDTLITPLLSYTPTGESSLNFLKSLLN